VFCRGWTHPAESVGARRLVGTVIVALYLPILSIVDALAGNQNPF
jgi:hypothetical protein